MFFHRLNPYLLVLCAAPVLHAEPLTLDRAMDLAVINQPLLAGQQAGVTAARENAVAEGQLPDPKLILGIRDMPVTGPDAYTLRRDEFTMRMIGVMQEFPRAEKRRLKGERAQQEAEMKVAEFDLTRRMIRRDAALAWLEVYSPQRAARLVRETQDKTQNQVETALIDYRAGRLNQQDVLASQVMLGMLKDRESELAKQEARARAMLARWIGEAAYTELSAALPENRDVPNLETLRGHLASHPQIALSDKNIAIAEAEVALARQAYKPDWNMELSYAQRGPAFSNMASLQFGIDLPVFPKNRQDKSLASKLSLLDQTRAAREDRLRSLDAELRGNYAEAQSAIERIARFEQTILPEAAQRAEAALIAYRAGKTLFATVLEARRAEIEARLQLLALQIEAARARMNLRFFSE